MRIFLITIKANLTNKMVLKYNLIILWIILRKIKAMKQVSGSCNLMGVSSEKTLPLFQTTLSTGGPRSQVLRSGLTGTYIEVDATLFN